MFLQKRQVHSVRVVVNAATEITSIWVFYTKLINLDIQVHIADTVNDLVNEFAKIRCNFLL